VEISSDAVFVGCEERLFWILYYGSRSLPVEAGGFLISLGFGRCFGDVPDGVYVQGRAPWRNSWAGEVDEAGFGGRAMVKQ
jgi:hypothetical protein